MLEAADRLLREGPEPAWELSWLRHLTLLSYGLVSDPRRAVRARVAGHLRSCWREDPVLSGAHRAGGIELGIRLSSLAWIRRLLDDWPGVAGLFERDALALRQIRRLPRYLGRVSQPGLVRPAAA